MKQLLLGLLIGAVLGYSYGWKEGASSQFVHRAAVVVNKFEQLTDSVANAEAKARKLGDDFLEKLGKLIPHWRSEDEFRDWYGDSTVDDYLK